MPLHAHHTHVHVRRCAICMYPYTHATRIHSKMRLHTCAPTRTQHAHTHAQMHMYKYAPTRTPRARIHTVHMRASTDVHLHVCHTRIHMQVCACTDVPLHACQTHMGNASAEAPSEKNFEAFLTYSPEECFGSNVFRKRTHNTQHFQNPQK